MTTDLIREVTAALATADVPHGPLQPGRVRNNVNLTDGVSVLVKVQGPTVPRQNLENELHAAAAVPAHATRPVVNRVLDTAVAAISVWKFEHGRTVRAHEISPAQARTVAAALSTVHDVDVNAVRPLPTMSKTYDTCRRRLPLASSLPPRLSAIASALADRYAGLDLLDLPAGTLTHGDVHNGNVLFDADRATLCDFESARRAPREWDIACLRHNLLRVGRRNDSWQAAYEVLTAHRDVDVDLVDRLEVTRALAATLHLLTQGRTKLAAARLHALAAVLDGAPMPPELPAAPPPVHDGLDPTGA